MNSELADTKWLIFRNHAVARLKKVDLDKQDFLIYRYCRIPEWRRMDNPCGRPDGQVLKTISVLTTKDWKITSTRITPVTGIHDLYFTYTNPKLKKPDDNGMQFDWFYFTESLPGKGNPDMQ